MPCTNQYWLSSPGKRKKAEVSDSHLPIQCQRLACFRPLLIRDSTLEIGIQYVPNE